MPTAARRGPRLPLPTIPLPRRGHPATPHGRCPRYDCQPQRFCPVWLTPAAPVGFAGEPVHQLPPRRHPPPRASGRPPRSGASAMIGSARTHDLPPRRPTVCVTRAGAGGGRRPTGKMIRRRKMLGIAPESPASGARFVGQFFYLRVCQLLETLQT
jgi:hypothetical protein